VRPVGPCILVRVQESNRVAGWVIYSQLAAVCVIVYEAGFRKVSLRYQICDAFLDSVNMEPDAGGRLTGSVPRGDQLNSLPAYPECFDFFGARVFIQTQSVCVELHSGLHFLGGYKEAHDFHGVVFLNRRSGQCDRQSRAS
jgi:hypothetical protein